MKIVCLLALFWIHTFQGATVPTCCNPKTVGGVEYILLEGEEVGPGYKTECLSDCVYEKKNDARSVDKYCFGAGNLTVECGDKTEPEMDGTDNSETTTDSTCGKTVTGDNFLYPQDCKPFNNRYCAPVTNILTCSLSEKSDGLNYLTFWTGPNGNTANFTLDLGCQQTFDTIQLVNTHNTADRDRATKLFNLYVSNTTKGPWTLVLEVLLYDSRNQTDPLPLQCIPLQTGEKTAQFIKFELITAWGAGGGLQFFDIVRKSDGKVEGGTCGTCRTNGTGGAGVTGGTGGAGGTLETGGTDDRIICHENLNKLHELLLDANNTIEVRCCANGYTNKTVSCGNGTDCSSVCGDTPTCAKVVVNEPEEGKNYCESKEQNTQDIHVLFIGSVPCDAATNSTCNSVSEDTNLPPPDKPNTYCNNKIDITAPGDPGVTLVQAFDFTASCSYCDPACNHCSICPQADFYNDMIAEFLHNYDKEN